MDRCDACPFVYDDVAIADLPAEIRTWGRILAEHLPADDPRIRTRPEPDVWSALEYACHVRDALNVQRGRVAVALAEDSPVFTPMGRDERAERDRYNDQDPTAVAVEVVTAADRFAAALDELTPLEWERTGIYTWPTTESRSLAWVGRHTLHELHHHTADIDRSLANPI
jgi:hypothetical protein